MKLTKFTAGQIVSIGLAATAFLLLLGFVNKRWPNAPVVSTVARNLP